MNKRLEEVRQYLGLSKTDFADTLGLKIHNIRDMETGKQKIGAEIATLIEEIFSISGWWLLTGKGSMLQQPQKSSTQNIQGNGNVSVNGFGNKVTKSGNTVAKQAEINSDLVEIPYFRDTYAAAGAGAINYDDAPKPMAFDKNFLRVMLGITTFKHIHIINAIGNSMTPTIKEGELLFVNPFENEYNQIKDGGIYIINCKNGVLVKRINHNPITGDIVLVSDNPNVADIQIKGDDFDSCKIIGRVVGHFSNL